MDRRWLLGGLLLAGGIGIARVLTARPKITQATRLMLIGDSLAQGLTPQFKALAADLGVPYLGRGVSGSRIDQWAASEWLGTYLEEFQPTLVLVSLGTNDAYMGGDVWARQKPSFDKLIARLTQFSNKYTNDEPGAVYGLGAKVVWIGPPSLPASYSGHHPDAAFLQELRDNAPNYFASDELEIPRGPDGLHPTISGYGGWAGAIWSWLT